MNETKTRPQKRRRSFLWLWILLLLAAFTGGIVLGLKLNTLPLPSDVQNRLYPVLEAIIPGSTAVRPEQAAPAATPAATLAPAVTTAPAVESSALVLPEPIAETTAPAEIPAAVTAEPVKAAPAESDEIEVPAAQTVGDTARFESAPQKSIGIDAALETALGHAGVEEKDANVTGVFRTKDEDGQPVYEVSFMVGEISYEYIISAADADILGWKMSGFHFSDTETFGTELTETAAVSSAEPVRMIEEKRAREIAYSDAGVKESDVKSSDISLVVDNGADCYRIRFVTASGSFGYKIDAFTGEILGLERP